ncbi:hypothetical protein HHK36_014647 [Tetracentron sinense]|uniref:Trehalose-phosphatase n=1 Tax=Tetracentron sinense TaxID=13715 RepID=A0A834Z0I9_TETSI|nr:hypothetical protein HHK36_014647 [Tetracentron sinense]
MREAGYSAEHGYFTRWSRESPWESYMLATDFDWKKIAEPAKELLDHLENVLANEPVVIKRGQHIVEAKPQGISKGIVVENLISTMLSRGKPPDFVLCIGDDRSDEDMFESIARSISDPSLPSIAEVFACTVGQKPSMASTILMILLRSSSCFKALLLHQISHQSQHHLQDIGLKEVLKPALYREAFRFHALGSSSSALCILLYDRSLKHTRPGHWGRRTMFAKVSGEVVHDKEEKKRNENAQQVKAEVEVCFTESEFDGALGKGKRNLIGKVWGTSGSLYELSLGNSQPLWLLLSENLICF